MLGFGAAVPLNREDSLRRAEDFRSRKQPKKAIAELEKVLKLDPADATAHARLGPLLVQVGERQRAVASFRVAAEDLDARGFADKALSLWLQIAQTQTTDVAAWQKVAQRYASRGHKADGVKVLWQASLRQEGREGRPRAVTLLRDLLRLDGRHPDGTLALARLLKKDGAAAEAKALLEQLLLTSAGPVRQRVRRAQLLLFPGPGTLWRWLRKR